MPWLVPMNVVAQIQKITDLMAWTIPLTVQVYQVVEKALDCLGTRGMAATVVAPAPEKRAGVNVFSHLVMGHQYIGCCEGDSVPQTISIISF